MDPYSLIDRAIAAHGGPAYQDVALAFSFRDKAYEIYTKGERFHYVRIQLTPEGDTLQDILTNEGLVRYQNGAVVELADSMVSKFAASVNSVAYFFLLPKPLRDPAVVAEYLGTATLEKRIKEKVRVTFRQEGGGTDHDDVFVYWFDQEQGTMTHFAYLYHTDGGGLRFRRAINSYELEGIRIQDYENYEADPASVEVEDADKAFEAGSLKLLSQIKQERVRTVRPNPLQ